jgi:hypothetical protein
MTLDVDSVMVAIVALTVLLLVAVAEAMWRRRGRRARAGERRPTSGTDPVTAVIHPARCRPVGRPVSGAQGLEHAQCLPRRPQAGWERGISKILAVYRTSPVMVVGETANSPTCTTACPRGSGGSSWSSIRSFRSGERRQGLTVPTVPPPRRPPEVTGCRRVWAPLSPGPIFILSGCVGSVVVVPVHGGAHA